MMESVVVCVLIGLALVFAGRSIYRTLNGKDGGCGCSSCPMSGVCEKTSREKAEPE